MHRTLIRGGQVLSDDDQARTADILIEDGRIGAVVFAGTNADGGDVPGRFGAVDEEIDAHDCAVLPGLSNAHTHAHSGLSRGAMPDRITLEGLLAHSAALLGSRSIEDIGLSARLSAAELVRRGCTSCIDMCSQLPLPTVEGIVAVGQAYASAGIRAVVAPMVSDRTLYQAYPELLAQLPAAARDAAAALRAPTADALLAPCRAAQRSWPFDRRFVQLGIGPAIPLHCSDELLAGCGALSAEFDVPLQTHLLESRLQAMAQSRSGESTVRRLQRLGCLTPRTSLAHGVWLSREDMALIAAAGATVVHNPGSNLRLGSGVAALRAMLDAGVNVAIGTDATNTSDGQNLFEAARLAAFLSRTATADPARWVDAGEAFALATRTAPRALALGPDTLLGRVAPGYRADLLLIDLTQPHYVPLRHLVRQMMFAENGSAIRRVLVDGRTVFVDGRVTGLSEPALRGQACEAQARLDALNAPALAAATAATGAFTAFCCQAQMQPYFVRRQLFAGDTAAADPEGY